MAARGGCCPRDNPSTTPSTRRASRHQALRAHKTFQKDKDYIVRDGEVVLIDEFTGRMMAGRRLSNGLHQAIEAKEGTKIQPENVTMASVTFQNYFRLYDKLSGMTGTAATEAEEFMTIYGLGVVEVPTNMPIARIDEDDQVFRTAQEKYDAIIATIRERTRGPAHPCRHHLDREVRDAVGPSAQGQGAPQRPERPPARARGPDHRRCRQAGRGHHRHEHGRPGDRHQLGGNVDFKVMEALEADPDAHPDEIRATIEAGHAAERKPGSRRPAACSSWPPSAMRAAASTTSCAAGPAGRATRAGRASSSASRMT